VIHRWRLGFDSPQKSECFNLSRPESLLLTATDFFIRVKINLAVYLHTYWLRCLHLTLAVVGAWEILPCLVCGSNCCIPFTSTLARSTVVYCLCENVQLLAVVFCVVVAVGNFGFRLFIKEASNKWRPILQQGYTIWFLAIVVADFKELFPLCAVKCRRILLSKGH